MYQRAHINKGYVGKSGKSNVHQSTSLNSCLGSRQGTKRESWHVQGVVNAQVKMHGAAMEMSKVKWQVCKKSASSLPRESPRWKKHMIQGMLQGENWTPSNTECPEEELNYHEHVLESQAETFPLPQKSLTTPRHPSLPMHGWKVCRWCRCE